jgi:tetratricopeptide (TPR) repeat protein
MGSGPKVPGGGATETNRRRSASSGGAAAPAPQEARSGRVDRLETGPAPRRATSGRVDPPETARGGGPLLGSQLPSHLAGALRAAAHARALAARIRANPADLDHEIARLGSAAETAAARAQPNAERVPKKHQAPQFARTVAAAQQALQEDGTAASWHLNPAPRGEASLGRCLLDWATLRLWRGERTSMEISWEAGEARTPRQPFNAVTYCGTRAPAQEVVSAETCVWSIDDKEQKDAPDGSVLAPPAGLPHSSAPAIAPGGARECENHPPLPAHRALVPVAPGTRPEPVWLRLPRMYWPPVAAGPQSLDAFLHGAGPARSPQPKQTGVASRNEADALASGLRLDAGTRESGQARPHTPSVAALGALLRSTILGMLCGVALAVSALGPLPGLQSLWSTPTDSGAQKADALAGADVQMLPADSRGSTLAAATAALSGKDQAPPRLESDPGPTGAVLTSEEAEASRASGVQSENEPSGPWNVLYERAHELQHDGEIAAAVDLFRAAARLNPAHPAILYDWGYALQLQGRREDAIEKYRQAIRLDPHHPYAHYNLGFLLQQQGDDVGAIESYRRSSEIRPDNPFLHFNWGRILEARGDFAGAAEHYRRAADLAPQSRPGLDARRRLERIDMTQLNTVRPNRGS